MMEVFYAAGAALLLVLALLPAAVGDDQPPKIPHGSDSI